MNNKQKNKPKAIPVPQTPANVFLLGTSEKSALLAAEKGIAYAFGHFMSEANGTDIVSTYQQAFTGENKPYTIIAVDAICAETTEEAEYQAQSVLLWRLRHDDILAKQTIPTPEEAKQTTLSETKRTRIEQMKKQMIIGNPQQVSAQLKRLQKAYGADEIMIVTIVHDAVMKQRSYELIAAAIEPTSDIVPS